MKDAHDQLERMFSSARAQALAYIGEVNAKLPLQCPRCQDHGHVPGLLCPACGYRHTPPWVILRDTEWGYEVVPLTNRRKVLAVFKVSPDEHASP
jgi:ribosomal protein L37E